jgi:hypothetical protein
MDSDDLIAEGFASYHATTGNDGYETAEETHTTNHEQPAESDTMAPTAGESEALPVHLGAYRDTPLDMHAGVVAPAACYVVIDGTSWNGKHKPAEYYMGWYGDQYGAEQRMKSSSIARAFQHIPGEEPPESRAHDMVRDLQNQGVATSNHKLDSRGHPEPRSMVKEVGDSAETAYQNEIYVTPKMVDRWKEIHWLCIDLVASTRSVGRPRMDRTPGHGLTFIRESKNADGESWPEQSGARDSSRTNAPPTVRERMREKGWDRASRCPITRSS